MGVTLFILAFDETSFASGEVSYWGQYLNSITALFPDFSSLRMASVDRAIGIFARRADDQKPARELGISSFQNLGNKVIIKFKVKANLDIDCGAVRRGLRGQLSKNGIAVNGPYLPFCCVVNTEDMAAILTVGGESQLSLMHSHFDWIGIHTKYQPIADLARNHPDLWTDVEALNMIGFACAKLSETSGNLRQMFRNPQEQQNFLAQQLRYRLGTEALRRRCIELQPNNAGALSNLAYFYYRSATELAQPGGRRDGNFREEANKAIEYFDKALELDGTRVSDLYRKGYLLADLFPKQILFGSNSGTLKERSERAKTCVSDGIQALESAIEVWESFNPTDRSYGRYQKDYIKSLYQAGGAYYSFIINDWDEAIYMLEMSMLITDADHVPVNSKDLENADKALGYFYACWRSERSDLDSDVPSEKSTAPSGAVDGVFKLYSLGKVRFAKFWILSGGGQRSNSEADGERDEAERLLVAALQQNWSPEKQRSKKDFIAELLARLYISKHEYAKACEVIGEHSPQRMDSYIATTLATALAGSKQYLEAQTVLDNASNNRGNKAVWKTLLYQGCVFLRMGLLDQAKQAVEAAEKEAHKQGKETVDTILIAYAFISYKREDVEEAVNYLIQAIRLNPHRLSVQKRLKRWQSKIVH